MGLLQDLRGPKIFDMAIADWITTVIVAWWISDRYHYDFWHALIMLIILAIVLHWITGTSTMLNAYIGVNSKEDVYISRMTNG